MEAVVMSVLSSVYLLFFLFSPRLCSITFLLFILSFLSYLKEKILVISYGSLDPSFDSSHRIVLCMLCMSKVQMPLTSLASRRVHILFL